MDTIFDGWFSVYGNDRPFPPSDPAARLALIESILRTATHEVLFDPAGPRHVMALADADYKRILNICHE